MKSKSGYIALLSVFVLSALACNIGVAAPSATEAPATDPNLIDVNAAITLAVQTLQAQTQVAQIATPTPLPGKPTVTVTTDTNCRVGPNINYSLVTVFKVGAVADVVAQYPDYWVIQYVGGNGATCWLWANYATVIGDTSQLPLGSPPPLPPTPTPAPYAPKSPNDLDISCTSVNKSTINGDFWLIKFEWTVEFTWNDRADNENGYSVYKQGSLLTTLGPNSEGYTDVFNTFLIIEPVTYTYGVQAYNDEGASDIKEIDLSSCDG